MRNDQWTIEFIVLSTQHMLSLSVFPVLPQFLNISTAVKNAFSHFFWHILLWHLVHRCHCCLKSVQATQTNVCMGKIATTVPIKSNRFSFTHQVTNSWVFRWRVKYYNFHRVKIKVFYLLINIGCYTASFHGNDAVNTNKYNAYCLHYIDNRYTIKTLFWTQLLQDYLVPSYRPDDETYWSHHQTWI